jgi:hypothetical protein
MIAIRNKHGLWYSGDQTYDNTPIFLAYPDYRHIYHSQEEANAVICRLEKKGIMNLQAIGVYKWSEK